MVSKKFVVSLVVALIASIGLGGSAGASGKAPVAGPGGSAVGIDWETVSKSATVENLWVQVTHVQVAKVNSCGTGISIWYYDQNWIKRNSYQQRDYCTWGPVWSMWTPVLQVRRGSCVQVTYRVDNVWRNGTTFCSQ